MLKNTFFLLFYLFFIKNTSQAQSVVSADKMNIFYIGVENPIEVTANGIPRKELEVTCKGAAIAGSTGVYTVTCSAPGEAQITVAHKGKTIQEHLFKIKRIPDPIVAIAVNSGSNKGGPIGNGIFRAVKSLYVEMSNFDFDAHCDIQSFNFTYIRNNGEIVTYPNQGGNFNANVLAAVKMASPGDTYYFDEVKSRCPGDDSGRPINSLVFNIK